MGLSLVAKSPEIVAPYVRQTELESTITRLALKYPGIRESELWLLIVASMPGRDGPAFALMTGTIHRMIRVGRLVGMDYEIADKSDTIVFPAGTRTVLHIPIKILGEEPLHQNG
jgi:hypothetical protein